MNRIDWPPVTILILNWNAAPFLPATLDALATVDYPDLRVLLVDNGSTDGSLALLADRYPHIPVHQTAHNQGFSAGNNAGLRQIDTPFVLLLNPDVTLRPHTVKTLIQPMLDDETIGVTGGKLLYPGETAVQFTGGIITWPQAFPQQTKHPTATTPQSVDYIIGAMLATRRDLLDTIGLLDEGFFLYYEDADLCARVRRHGHLVIYVPEATAVHHESATTDRRTDFYWEMMFRGRWRYLLKQQTAVFLTQETLPTELAWLERITAQQRRTAALAYSHTLSALPEIAATRTTHGAEPLTDSELADLRTGLQTLILRAWQPLMRDLEALQTAARVTERPFHSTVPLLGPLIAWFRTQWLNMAAKWYIRPQVAQQNQFNHQLVNRLREQAERLQAIERAHAEMVAETAVLQEKLNALRPSAEDEQ